MNSFSRIKKLLLVWICMTLLLSAACQTEEDAPTLSTPSITQTREPQITPTQTDIIDEVTLPTSFISDETLAHHIYEMASDNFQGTVFVGISGQRIYEASFGYSDVERRALLSDESVFELGLLTGQLTQQAFIFMIEEEGLNLEDLVSEYIPEYEFADQMNLGHLLNMSSGIPDYLNNTIADDMYLEMVLRQGITRQDSLEKISEYSLLDPSFEWVMQRINNESLLYEPGERRGYSASNHVFMAEIIYRVTGVPYVHYLQRSVLTPMQLDSASFTETAQTATGYLYADQMQIAVPSTRLLADAGLRMSASDLFIWTNELIPYFMSDEDALTGPTGHFFELPKSIYMAESAIGGFYCIQVVIPEIELVVIVLSNQNRMNHPANDIADKILDYYIDLFDIYEDN